MLYLYNLFHHNKFDILFFLHKNLSETWFVLKKVFTLSFFSTYLTCTKNWVLSVFSNKESYIRVPWWQALSHFYSTEYLSIFHRQLSIHLINTKTRFLILCFDYYTELSYWSKIFTVKTVIYIFYLNMNPKQSNEFFKQWTNEYSLVHICNYHSLYIILFV